MAFGETMLRLGPAGGDRLEQARRLDVHVAGSESNTLACLARLGLSCAWLSALPDNAPGQLVARTLAGHGVETRHVAWAEASGRVGLYWVEQADPPLGTQVVYDRAGSALSLLQADDLDLVPLDGARLLHLTGITPALGAGPREAWWRLLRRARTLGIPVSLDMNYRAKLWSTAAAARELDEAGRMADLLFCTQEDATALWGSSGSPEELLRALAGRFGAEQTLVVTLGAAGSAELRAGTYTPAAAYPSDGSHRFGSGDAFAAGYLYAHLAGEHFARAQGELGATPLQFGNAVAALKRSIAGDIAVVNAEEVLAVMRGEAARFR
ncbi:MAG: sugar kinase [Chloroflexota bacterium]|nr:sugar kinase [Chloroflexota bacterium]